jgi:microcystin-dependent protein
MSEPFLSEIKIMGFNFPPKGWAFCNGQLLPINQNQALFSLVGTTYGGDGRVNFGLPNLQGRIPIHFGNGHILGQLGGEVNHTLTISEIPTHVHSLSGTSNTGNLIIAAGNLPATSPTQLYEAPDNNLVAMNPASIANAGGSQPHPNMQPYLVLSFCIALQGIYPSQN